MSPLQPHYFSWSGVAYILSCVFLVLYFKIIVDYICWLLWVWINMDQS